MPTVPVAGDNSTLATGGRNTAISPVALCPSDVPVIVAVPAAMPRTTPRDETVATAGLEDVHANTLLGSGAAPASNASPVSGSSALTARSAVAGATVTAATGTVLTVSGTVWLRVSAVAVISVVPAASAVTTPLPSTVATAGSELVKLIVRPGSGVPSALRAMAVSAAVAPTPTTGVGGRRETLATGTSADGSSGSPPHAAARTSAAAASPANPRGIRRSGMTRRPRRSALRWDGAEPGSTLARSARPPAGR